MGDRRNDKMYAETRMKIILIIKIYMCAYIPCYVLYTNSFNRPDILYFVDIKMQIGTRFKR